MTPIVTMTKYIEDAYADIFGERISTLNARKLATIALQGLLDDLAGNIRASHLASLVESTKVQHP